MRITTKRGDGGKTQTCKGKFVPKCDLKIRSCGALDEAISFLGLAKAKTKDTAARKTIDSVQKDLLKKKINPCILAYLNRLSDLLFIMAVYEEGKSQPLRL